MSEDLDQLAEAVLRSRNYRAVCDDLVREIGAGQLESQRSLKEAIKATKNKLHQIGGAYLEGGTDYGKWLADLQAATLHGCDAFRETCRRIMGHHASTRERLPMLERFYAAVLDGLGPIHSVLDVGCGLNPLAVHAMPLAPDAQYHAYDMYSDLAEFLNAFFSIAGVNGRAFARNLARHGPEERADVALVLKLIPCLDQIDRDAASRLLDSIDAERLVASFPAHSLGGRRRGMPANYEARFRDLAAGRNWDVRRVEFETELAFVVRGPGQKEERTGSAAAGR